MFMAIISFLFARLGLAELNSIQLNLRSKICVDDIHIALGLI